MAIKLKKVLAWLLARIKEPSTYAGAAAVAVVVGKPDLANDIGQIGQAIVLITGGGLMAYGPTPTVTE